MALVNILSTVTANTRISIYGCTATGALESFGGSLHDKKKKSKLKLSFFNFQSLCDPDHTVEPDSHEGHNISRNNNIFTPRNDQPTNSPYNFINMSS